MSSDTRMSGMQHKTLDIKEVNSIIIEDERMPATLFIVNDFCNCCEYEKYPFLYWKTSE